jgi:thiamine biosynthesis lipoprotein
MIPVVLAGIFASLATPAGTAQAPTLTRFTFTEYHMGVDARIVVYAPSQTVAEKACAAGFERMAALDTIMSDYRKNSELMQLCAKAYDRPVKVSPELFKVLQVSAEFSSQSGGMFDITVGPVVQLWRRARKTHILPTDAEIQTARKLVGWQKVKLDARHQTVWLAMPGMRLDLGAIGKGFADDEVQTVLKRYGIRSALVQMGGDIVVSDPPPNTDGWKVEVLNDGPGPGASEISVSNCAISTSGDLEQHVDVGGIRYSHVVNPITGYALKNSAQATVICRTGLISDPLSTALTLLNSEERQRILKHYPGTKLTIRATHPD